MDHWRNDLRVGRYVRHRSSMIIEITECERLRTEEGFG
jgi:hypothetical protein